MARGVNKVILVGTAGGDVETRQVKGTTFGNVSIATSEQWTDKQTGQKVEKTEWHRISFIGKVAEIAGTYLRKGGQVYIEGKLQTREWEKDGIKRYSTDIVVDMNGTMQLLGNSNQGGDRQPQSNQVPQPQRATSQQPQPQGSTQTPQAPGAMPDYPPSWDEDIPFRPVDSRLPH